MGFYLDTMIILYKMFNKAESNKLFSSNFIVCIFKFDYHFSNNFLWINDYDRDTQTTAYDNKWVFVLLFQLNFMVGTKMERY